MQESPWYLYIIRTADDRLYTGITTDLQRRLDEHASGGRLAAKALRGRQPLRLDFSWAFTSRSAASSAEFQVKRLKRSLKESLISGEISLPALLEG